MTCLPHLKPFIPCPILPLHPVPASAKTPLTPPFPTLPSMPTRNPPQCKYSIPLNLQGQKTSLIFNACSRCSALPAATPPGGHAQLPPPVVAATLALSQVTLCSNGNQKHMQTRTLPAVPNGMRRCLWRLAAAAAVDAPQPAVPKLPAAHRRSPPAPAAGARLLTASI